MKKVLLVSAWFPSSLLVLALSFFFLNTITRLEEVPGGNALLSYQAHEMLPKNGYEFYAALPEVLGSFTTAIDEGDARPIMLEKFLEKHNSPLVPYTNTIIYASDQESIDFRLIPAIAMCESNLGKKIPKESYNAWGYAIYTGQNSGAEFDGWDHAVNVMASYLSKKYIHKGLVTPEEIGPIYAPPSVNTDNSWAKCVRKFMDQLK